jgi:hypothetical protein
MATYATLKKVTAYLMGKTDNATSSGNEIREYMINVARSEIANAYPFAWLRKIATVTITANAGDVPTDWNPLFPFAKVQDNNGNRYRQIPPKDAVLYSSTKEYVYWITYTTKYVINTIAAPTSLSVTYNYVPTDLAQDADVDLCPDMSAISYRAAAKTWLAKERNDDFHDKFMILAEQRLQKLIELESAFTDDKDTLSSIPAPQPIPVETKKK